MVEARSIWSNNPIPAGCVYYLPLWALSGSAFNSIDPFGYIHTVTGAVKVDKGYSFDEADDYMVVTGTPAFTSDQAGSLCAWVYVISSAGEQAIFSYSKLSTGDVDTYRFLVNASTARPRAFIYRNTADTNYRVAAGSMSLDTWVFLTFGSDGSNNFIHINGADQILEADTAGGAWFGDLVTDADQITIGAQAASGGYNFDFGGTIGEIYVYDRGISAAESLYIYNQTKGRYL